MKRKSFSTVMFLAAGILIMGFTVISGDPWPVPDKYVKMPNPIKSDAASISAGKSLWAKHCQSCHGKSGLGDGSKAAQLKTPVGDLSVASFQKQTDGSIFYKTSEGRDDMPSFKKKIPDQDDIWNLVNYMRTFKK